MKTPDAIKKGLECCANEENKDFVCSDCPYDNVGSECGDLFSDALALIQQREEEKARLDCTITQLTGTVTHLRGAVPSWISATQPPKKWRLDDEQKTLINFLIYSPEFGVDVGNYLEPANVWMLFGVPVKVTHWMPLPEPPKE